MEKMTETEEKLGDLKPEQGGSTHEGSLLCPSIGPCSRQDKNQKLCRCHCQLPGLRWRRSLPTAHLQHGLALMVRCSQSLHSVLPAVVLTAARV